MHDGSPVKCVSQTFVFHTLPVDKEKWENYEQNNKNEEEELQERHIASCG